MPPRIEIKNLSLRFRKYNNPNPALKEAVIEAVLRKQHAKRVEVFTALNNINLSIRDGERVGIIGLNGAGKSTLLMTVAGIYAPHEGSVSVQGRITPLLSVGTGFDMELSGRENIYLNGALLGYPPKDMKKREQAIIDFADLHNFIDTPIKYYSSGMHARLAFALATTIDPEIFIVDEVFAAGDAQFVGKATVRMQELFNSARIVLFVSHSIHQVIELCNRAIVLHHGNILFDGTPSAAAEFYDSIVNGQILEPESLAAI